MRILILSANTGGGHNSTAKALAEQMEKLKIEYEIADTLAFISEKVSDLISRGHSYVYRRLPRLFGIGYRYEESHSVRFLYNQCAKGADALWEKLNSQSFDAVLCAHVFAGLMMTELRSRYGGGIPCYFLATDYTCSPGVSEMRLDGYFIPHRMLLGEFSHSGVPADRLIVTGIPVGSVFYERGSKEDARRVLGLPQDQRIVLLCCGSMGCGNLERSARRMLGKMPPDSCLVVVCGRNEKAYEALKPYESQRFAVLPFVENITDYMTAADLYVTKPGGLTTTEAIVKGLPMILVDTVGGCETRNYRFLMDRGVAKGAKNWRQANGVLKKALQEDWRWGNAPDFCEGNAADAVCQYLLRSLKAK